MPRPRHLLIPRAARGGFTLVELLLAATVTALVTTVAATLVSAVTHATTQTRDVRATKAAGDYALRRIARTIRQARGIGQVTATAVTLWLDDANGDDQLNLYETGMIRYDAAAKQVLYERLVPAGPTPTTLVAVNDFENAATMQTLLTSPDKKSVVWADSIEALSFTGYPSLTDTRIVETLLTIGTGPDAVDFRTAAAPRASADYLLATNGQAPPLPGSTRARRRLVGGWDGVMQIIQQEQLTFQ